MGGGSIEFFLHLNKIFLQNQNNSFFHKVIRMFFPDPLTGQIIEIQ